MRNAMSQEAVLLAHDFGGDLENGLGPLIQRLEQPVGRIEALRQIGLGLFVSTVARIRTAYPRVVAAVHQNARQGVAVEFHIPAAVLATPDIDIRDTSLQLGRAR